MAYNTGYEDGYSEGIGKNTQEAEKLKESEGEDHIGTTTELSEKYAKGYVCWVPNGQWYHLAHCMYLIGDWEWVKEEYPLAQGIGACDHCMPESENIIKSLTKAYGASSKNKYVDAIYNGGG